MVDEGLIRPLLREHGGSYPLIEPLLFGEVALGGGGS